MPYGTVRVAKSLISTKMKNAIKYLLIVSGIIVLNFLFWKTGDDCLSDKIKDQTSQSVLFDLTLMGTLALIIIGIVRGMVGFLSFVPKTQKVKLILGLIITLAVFANTTILNTKNMTSSMLRGKRARLALCEKIKDANYMAYGTAAKELTFKEYQQVRNLIDLPSISNQSYDISYLFSYDGFLPDYILEISYKLPKGIEVDNKEERSDSGQGLKIEELEDYNLVHYSEYDK